MSQEGPPGSAGAPATPWERLGVLAQQRVEVAPGLRHVEAYTLEGLLSVLWHGPEEAASAVVLLGGAMGGLLGPAGGLYHDLGVELAEAGIGTWRVSYRRPNDLRRCVHDALAVADVAARRGARRFVVVGHSFGGAVAVQLALALGDHCTGVVLLATQSAGCEAAEGLHGTPLLLLHGDRDEILPPMASEVVHALAGGEGELVILPGTGHLLSEAGDELRSRLRTWIPTHLASAR